MTGQHLPELPPDRPLGLYEVMCEHDAYDILRAVNAWLDQHKDEALPFVAHLRAYWGAP